MKAQDTLMGGGLPGGEDGRLGRAEKPAADAEAGMVVVGGDTAGARLFAPHCLQQLNLFEASPPHLGLSWNFLPQPQVIRIGVLLFFNFLARWRSLSWRSLAEGVDPAACDDS